MKRISLVFVLSLSVSPAQAQHVLGTTFVDLGTGQMRGHLVDINPTTGVGVLLGGGLFNLESLTGVKFEKLLEQVPALKRAMGKDEAK